MVSGVGFVIYSYCITAVFFLSAMSRCLWPEMVPKAEMPDEFAGNPIMKELDFFAFAAQMNYQLGSCLFILAMSRQRKKIAAVFNMLNELWFW